VTGTMEASGLNLFQDKEGAISCWLCRCTTMC